MTASTNPSIDAFLACVEKGAMASCEVWTPDVVLDATVPDWRFRMQGPEAIRAEYSTWFADPGHFDELRRVPLPDGEMVEYLLTWMEHGVQHAAHHMHVFELRDGLICSDTVMCGGRWPESLIAEMKTAQDNADAHDHT